MSHLIEDAKRERKVTLQWRQMTKIGVSYSAFVGGSATLVGNRVFYSYGVGKFAVISREDWSVKDLGSPFRHLGHLFQWHVRHVAQLVDDKIFFCAGDPSMPLVEYDVVLGQAREVLTDVKGPIGRTYMTSVYAPWRNEIITFGGFMNRSSVRSNETHAFNAESKSWKLLELRGKQPEARTGHAAALYGTKMYIYGGYGTGSRLLGDLWIAELRNYSEQSWTQPKTGGDSPFARSEPSLNVLDGILVMFGGNTEQVQARQDIEIYTPKLGSWRRQNSSLVRVKGSPPSNMRSHRGLSVSDGIIYFTKFGIYKLSQN